jgi:mono/diheme cytochrome c family protein
VLERSRSWLLALTALAALPGCGARGDKAEASASLAFVDEGKPVATLERAALEAKVKPERWSAYDPYYNRKKSYLALPLRPVLEAGFGRVDPGEQFLLKARDGYTVPISGARLLEPGAYVAVADLDRPGWEPIGPQQANPGPFYLVWRNDNQQDLESHPRPWQLATIEKARFEQVYPHTDPTGEPPDAPSRKGYALFRDGCVRCHAINREGGRVGPELNVPQSIVEYRPEAQIKAYIRNPLQFRYGAMPAHPHLTDPDLDALVAYFRAMSRRKHDPEGRVGAGGAAEKAP